MARGVCKYKAYTILRIFSSMQKASLHFRMHSTPTTGVFQYPSSQMSHLPSKAKQKWPESPSKKPGSHAISSVPLYQYLTSESKKDPPHTKEE